MKFPHPNTIKNRWLRRAAIVVTMPYAIGLSLYGVFMGAKALWSASYIPPQG
jgi:hypothetical protein